MNIDSKFIFLVGLFILLFLIYYKNNYINNTKNYNKFKGGAEDVINCTLEEVLKHNLRDNKWIYVNGSIYDVTYIINDDLDSSLPTLFKNVSTTNARTLINLIKYTDLQDLHKIFRSYTYFNDYVNTYNIDEKNTVKVEEFKVEGIDASKDIASQTSEKFTKFKLVFLISITQFKKGVICPAGLTI